MQKGGDFARIGIVGHGILAAAPTDAVDAAAWDACLQEASFTSLKQLFTVGGLPAAVTATDASKKIYLNGWIDLIKNTEAVLIPVEVAQRAILSADITTNGPITLNGKTYPAGDITPALRGDELAKLILHRQEILKLNIDAGAMARQLIIRMLNQYEAVLNMGVGTNYMNLVPTNKFEKLLNNAALPPALGAMSLADRYMNIEGLLKDPNRAKNILMHSVERIINMYKDPAVIAADIATMKAPVGFAATAGIAGVNHFDINKRILVQKMTEQCVIDIATLTNDDILDGWVHGGQFVIKSILPNVKAAAGSLLTSPSLVPAPPLGRPTGAMIAATAINPANLVLGSIGLNTASLYKAAVPEFRDITVEVMREIMRACKATDLNTIRIPAAGGAAAIGFDPWIMRKAGAARSPVGAGGAPLDTIRDNNIENAAMEILQSVCNLKNLDDVAGALAPNPYEIEVAMQLIAEYFIDHLVDPYFNLIVPPPIGPEVTTQKDRIRLELVAKVFSAYYERAGMVNNIYEEIINTVLNADEHTIEDFWNDFYEVLRVQKNGAVFTPIAIEGIHNGWPAPGVPPPAPPGISAGDIDATHGGITDSFGRLAGKVLIAVLNKDTKHPLDALLPNFPNQSFHLGPITDFTGIPELAFYTVPFLDIPATGANPARALTLEELFKWFDPVSLMFVIRLLGTLGF